MNILIHGAINGSMLKQYLDLPIKADSSVLERAITNLHPFNR